MWMIFLILFASSAFAADIAPTGFTATWDVPADQTVQYEFRVSNFALPAPLSLGVRPSMPNSLTFTFTSPLPNVPDTGRWECLDARGVKAGVAGPWLSETPGGAACGQVGLSAVTPTPIPVPTPAPIPQPVPHGLVIASQTETQIVITANNLDCPKVTTSTAGSTTAKPKRTITCVK